MSNNTNLNGNRWGWWCGLVWIFVLGGGLNGCAGVHHFEPQSAAHEQYEVELNDHDQPAAAEAFYLAKRLAPGMSALPVERLIEAQNQALRLPLYSSASGAFIATAHSPKSLNIWTELGPGNIGGRTRVFRFSPGSSTIIYAAGVAGGVWKTTDAGANWVALGDALANMAISSFAINPVDPNILYAGTGEGYFNGDGMRGAGVFKSIDAGAHWSQLSTTAPPGSTDFTRVNDLAISPNFPNVIYAATRTGLFRSMDSGDHWQQQINANGANGCMKIAVRSDLNPDNVVATCGTLAPTNAVSGIWLSDNASDAASPVWEHRVGAPGSGAAAELANMGRIGIAIAPLSQSVMYALTACSASGADQCGPGNEFNDGLLNVMISLNGGVDWVTQYSNSFTHTENANLMLSNPFAARCSVCGCGGDYISSQGWYDNAIAVDPADISKVWVGGIDLWRSDDAGLSFGVASEGGSTRFDSSDPHYVHEDIHTISFDPNYNGSSNTTIYATSDGGLFKSTNARASVGSSSANDASNSVCGLSNRPAINWSSLNHAYGVTQFYRGTVYPDGTRYFGGAQDNGTLRGSDSGGSNAWSEITRGDGGYTAMDRSSSGASTVLYASPPGISIKKSINDGVGFSCATNGLVDCASSVANDCGLFINPFTIDPNNNARLYTSGTRLWRTSNAAGLWVQASVALSGASCGGSDSGERFSAMSVAVGNADLLVAGTNRGRICRLTAATTSTGTSSLQNCSSPAGSGSYVADVGFDPENASLVYAAVSTFGVGHVWKSMNGGADWVNIDGVGLNVLPDVPAHTVAVSPGNANTLYVGTDIGVFVSVDGGLSWARENTGFANVITDHLVFNASGPSGLELFAFTHGRGVFKTTIHSDEIFLDRFE